LNKKILSSLITTILIVSILTLPAPIATAKDIELIDKISLSSGPIGVTVTVNGTADIDINATYPVQIYWCKQDPPYKGYGYGYGITDVDELLATVDSPADPTVSNKTYEVDITVPHVPTNGTYYIVAWQDKNDDDIVDSDEYDTISFTVVQGIYPDEGNVGDSVIVGGWATPGGLVEVYWDYVKDENKLDETYAKGDGSFSITVTIPEAPYESATHYIIVYDAAAGQNVFSEKVKIIPEITLDPSTTLPGKTVTVDGTGFAAEQDITLAMFNDTWSTTLATTPSTVTTDVNGSFSCTFKVPSGLKYMSYTVNATDEDGNVAEATLTIGAIITLSPEEGPSGTVVTITGDGWDAVAAGTEVTVKIDSMECPLVSTIKVSADGTFEGEFIVPTLDVDTYTVNATAGNVSGTLSFDVTGTTSITLSPTSGAPGSSVTIEGINFTAQADVEVTIDFGPIEGVATAKTNSTGGFKTTITVPPLTPQVTPYNVTATDENGLNATATFRVALTTLAVSPSSGPTGTEVLVVGGGFTPGEEFNVTIDGTLMVNGTGTIDPDTGNVPPNFKVYVPTVPVGTYTITVTDEEGVTATATFEVTETTEIVLTPSSAPQGYNVTIELNYFTAANETGIDLKIYNVTAEGEIYWEEDLSTLGNFTPSTVQTDETGSFEATFIVPDELALGDYYINATDDNDLWAQATFSVVEPTVIVYTGADTYMPGDTVAFFAKCTFSYAEAQTINVYTPSNFKMEVSMPKITTKVGDYYTGTASMILPSDAELGTWTWNTTIGGKTVNDTFTVIEKPTMAALSVEVSRLKEDVASLAETVEDLSSMAEAQAIDIDKLSTAVSNLRRAVSDLSDALSSLQSDVSDVASAVSSAQSAAEAASDAASAAQSAAAGISTAVYGAVILSLIAAVAAIMSIVILQRKIAG